MKIVYGHQTDEQSARAAAAEAVMPEFPVNTKHMYSINFVQCWTNVETLGRRCTNVIQMFCVCRVTMYPGKFRIDICFFTGRYNSRISI